MTLFPPQSCNRAGHLPFITPGPPGPIHFIEEYEDGGFCQFFCRKEAQELHAGCRELGGVRGVHHEQERMAVSIVTGPDGAHASPELSDGDLPVGHDVCEVGAHRGPRRWRLPQVAFAISRAQLYKRSRACAWQRAEFL